MSNNPTAKQRRTWDKIARIGCMACLQEGNHTQPEIHHVMDYGYRNHDKVFGLCGIHHKATSAVVGILNRHLNQIEFENKYGTDRELFELCMNKL